jgi:hypothetical protein
MLEFGAGMHQHRAHHDAAFGKHLGRQRRPAPVREIAAAVDGAIEDGCARYRLPRPLLTFSPGWDLVDCVIG